jgi:adenosylcobinamide kinase/adenosylcobinamide-phosphate guanylyltransferase
MCPLTLVTGGARSGKSRHVEELAREQGGPVTVIATAEALDDDMASRIARHRADRPAHWTTIEAPLAVAEAATRIPRDHVVILDCLTLWVSNLLLAQDDGQADGEAQILAETDRLLDAFVEHAVVLVVTNEVGLGIVPETALGRRFRDLLGRVNQRAAARASRVVLLVAGLPLRVK